MADLLMKQARAIVDERTTVICLDIHGVIMPVDKPFETLAGDFMSPPFHVHCRTLVGPYMTGFVREARLAANAELVKRPKAQRRKGPGGPAGDIPGPVTSNPPSGFSRAVDDHAMAGQDARNKAKPLFDAQSKRLADAGKGASGAADDGWAPTVEAVAAPVKALAGHEAAVEVQARFVPVDDAVAGSFDAYVGSGHTTVNNALRGGTPVEELPAGIGRRITNLDAGIAAQAPLQSPVTGYRGGSGRLWDRHEVGETFRDDGFMSVSLDPRVTFGFMDSADSVFIELVLPSGARIGSVNLLTGAGGVMDSEAEVLLARGSQFRVLSKAEEKVPGYGVARKIVMELIP